MRPGNLLGCLLIGILAAPICTAAPNDDPLVNDLKNTPPVRKEATKPAPSLAQRLVQELTGGEDIGEEDENPLLRIRRRMKLAEELIAAKGTSSDTQELQQLIAKELAQLVEQAQKQGQSGSGGQRKPQAGKQSKSANPMGEGTGEAKAGQPRDSSQRVEQGSPDATTAEETRALMRGLWGHLPEKVREQMLNAPAEQFLPKYEKLIQEYFKRLSEEPFPR